jgi:hypothetical protein
MSQRILLVSFDPEIRLRQYLSCLSSPGCNIEVLSRLLGEAADELLFELERVISHGYVRMSASGVLQFTHDRQQVSSFF